MPTYPKGKTEEDIERAYKEAYRESKIIYPKKINWLQNSLKNFNHLNVHQRKKRNLIVVLLDLILMFYYFVNDHIKKIIIWLYPRKDIIYGVHKDAYITGKLTFAKKNDSSTPIHNIDVALWARTKLGGWRKMSEGATDREGTFKLSFDFLESRKYKYKKFYFEIYQTTHVFFNQESGEPSIKDVVFERFPIKKSEFSGMGYNLGTMQLFYWEYRTDVPLPRVVVKDHDQDAPEYYAPGRNKAIQEQFIPVNLIKDEHLVLIALNPNLLTIPKIQADYPINLTAAMEKILPYSTRCDYWFGRRIMNGMNCATFQKDEKNEGLYWVKFFGACNYKINDEYAFPTVKIQFKIAENGLPLPLKIKTVGPINAFDKDPYQVHEFTPSDGEKWEQAKRVARVTGALSTETDDHFVGTHLNTEQYAIAVRRNIRKNPISTLLLPHLKEVALVNHTADEILIGPGYIPKASAVTEDGIIERAKDTLGANDWKNWKPMTPISDQHTYAKAENIFWEVVHDFVDYFFKENEALIEKEWYEIYCFSNDLVHNSVPLFLSTVDEKTLTASEIAMNRERVKYFHQRYRLDINLPRVSINGVVKCISPITTNKEAPEEGDMKNLKAVCKYAIMMATFMHTYVNEHQYEDIGEILYCSLGLRFGQSKEGIFRPEDDYSISPDVTRSTQMLWFSNLLSRTEYGFITRNEEHDIHPYFCKLLKEKAEVFAELNVEVDNIESRTNI